MQRRLRSYPNFRLIIKIHRIPSPLHFFTIKPNQTMSIQALIDKIEHFKTAIESVEVLILEHNEVHLRPALNHLKEQKQTAVKQLSKYQEVNRLSHI